MILIPKIRYAAIKQISPAEASGDSRSFPAMKSAIPRIMQIRDLVSSVIPVPDLAFLVFEDLEDRRETVTCGSMEAQIS